MKLSAGPVPALPVGHVPAARAPPQRLLPADAGHVRAGHADPTVDGVRLGPGVHPRLALLLARERARLSGLAVHPGLSGEWYGFENDFKTSRIESDKFGN